MTAKIKLNAASGGGSVSLKAPSTTTSNAAVELQLPIADGSAGQFMKTDGSGNLSFDAAGGGKFASYAIIADEKAYNTGAGDFTSGDWRTRDLNTELADADGIVSISSNQFTLQAGTYLIKAACPAYFVHRHVAKLYNVTDSSDAITGQTAGCFSSDAQTNAFLFGRVTIGAAKVFEIRHRCQTSYANSIGLGIPHNFSGNSSIYTVVEIYKES